MGFENKLLEGITLVDADIIFPTLDDARIHMGIPLTLYDVCIH